MGGLNVDLLNMIIMQKVLRFLIHYIQTSFCHITQHHPEKQHILGLW